MHSLMRHDGLLLIDKISGITSHDVVDRFRRVTKIKKAGHTGTLDPLATGLLVLCVERTTRLQSYLTGLEKTYEGEIQFGWATETYDADGAAIGDATAKDVSGIDFSEALGKLSGEIEQMPPAYSAKKIEGRRAYDIARSGETPALKTKNVTVYEFVLTAVNADVATFRVRCSAGTYIRSLAHDLGTLVGVPAHLKSLRRTAIGNFRVDDAIGFQKLTESDLDTILSPPHFVPMNRIQLPLEEVVIDVTQEQKILHGQSIVLKPSVESLRSDDLVRIMNLDDELVGIGVVSEVLREGGGPVAIQPKVVLK